MWNIWSINNCDADIAVGGRFGAANASALAAPLELFRDQSVWCRLNAESKTDQVKSEEISVLSPYLQNLFQLTVD